MIARLLRLFRDRRGIAVVELAFVLPIMVVLFFGCYEGTRAITAAMKVANAAQAYANLIAQQSSVSSASMANLCVGARMVMFPFARGSLSASATSVSKNGSGSIAQDSRWPDTTSCGAGVAISDWSTLATPLLPNNGDSVIIVRVSYSYTSWIHYIFPGSITFSQTAYARPRNVASVTHS